VIVEGYTDALMAHQAGFTNVVASLGTALTPGQVAVLTRYARKVALAYDVDPAGQSAGSFGVSELNNLISEVQQDGGVGLTDVGVVRLPEGKAQLIYAWVRQHHLDILVLWFIIIIGFILKHFWYYYGKGF